MAERLNPLGRASDCLWDTGDRLFMEQFGSIPAFCNGSLLSITAQKLWKVFLSARPWATQMYHQFKMMLDVNSLHPHMAAPFVGLPMLPGAVPISGHLRILTATLAWRPKGRAAFVCAPSSECRSCFERASVPLTFDVLPNTLRPIPPPVHSIAVGHI
jgi:hypothetical protein